MREAEFPLPWPSRALRGAGCGAAAAGGVGGNPEVGKDGGDER